MKPMTENKGVIEVVCLDMMCFKVKSDTLEPVTCSYYESAAWTDPQGMRQMSFGEWSVQRANQYDKEKL